MKNSKLLGRIFSYPESMIKYHGKAVSAITGNSIIGTFLAVETFAIGSGRTPDYSDVAIGGLCYAGDRIKNKIIDTGIPHIESGFEKISSYLKNKLNQ